MKDHQNPPGIFKRLAVIVYDLLLLIAVFFAATLAILPFQKDNLFEPNSWMFSVYLLLVSFVFYGWFWTRGGQTLGLVAWKLQVVNNNGSAISWKQAFIRFTTAILSWGLCGVGIAWMLFNKDRLMWHDIASKSHLDWKESD
ncbi:MAG TPA: RDD family protein [Cycloclasticus sp.]|jgi:uncharacterized RDD family membrane protein YckC|nr:RDD family protein [Cycloclasticus sp.]HIL93834.1 RDD family protein [Cycloclasticus sp.]